VFEIVAKKMNLKISKW